MPSTATITTYYSFVAGTKARASEMTYNFGLYRGHNIPIDPNTATGSDNTYSLGSTEYRWKKLYLGTIGQTTSASAGDLAVSGQIDLVSSSTITTTAIAGSTITVASTGRPIQLWIQPFGNTSAADLQIITNTQQNPIAQVSFYIARNTITSLVMGHSLIQHISASTGSLMFLNMAYNTFYSCIDLDLTTGSNSYFLAYKTITGTFSVSRLRLLAKEI